MVIEPVSTGVACEGGDAVEEGFLCVVALPCSEGRRASSTSLERLLTCEKSLMSRFMSGMTIPRGELKESD